MKQPKKLTRNQKACLSAHSLDWRDWMLVEETEFYYRIIHKESGYDNKSGNAPVLVIGRNTKHGIDVINVFKGEAAKDIYRQLTTPSTLKL